MCDDENLIVSEINDLEDKLKEAKATNKKLRKIRNLSIFKDACISAVPFVLSTTIISGVVFITGSGLPFVMDDVSEFKRYELEYSVNGEIVESEEYVRKADDEKSSIKVYSPYSLGDDGRYQRTVKCYEDEFDDKDIFEAILANDLSYVYSNLERYDTVTESTYLSFDENDYKLSADIVYYDREDLLWTRESFDNNRGITIFDVFFGIIVGCLGLLPISDRIIDIKYEIQSYKNTKVSTKDIKRRLKEARGKVLCLRKGGDKGGQR